MCPLTEPPTWGPSPGILVAGGAQGALGSVPLTPSLARSTPQPCRPRPRLLSQQPRAGISLSGGRWSPEQGEQRRDAGWEGGREDMPAGFRATSQETWPCRWPHGLSGRLEDPPSNRRLEGDRGAQLPLPWLSPPLGAPMEATSCAPRHRTLPSGGGTLLLTLSPWPPGLAAPSRRWLCQGSGHSGRVWTARSWGSRTVMPQ